MIEPVSSVKDADGVDSFDRRDQGARAGVENDLIGENDLVAGPNAKAIAIAALQSALRSEELTSELQSVRHLVCRPPSLTLFPYTTLFRSRRSIAPGALNDRASFQREGCRRRRFLRSAGSGSACRCRERPDRRERSGRRPECESDRQRGPPVGPEIGRAHV